MRATWTLAIALSAVVVAGCARRDSSARDSAAVDSARASVARDTAPSPRVVPYNPSAPGAMRGGDTPIRATPAAPSSPAPTLPAPSPMPASAQPRNAPATVDSMGDAVAIVREYYAAIRAHDFLRAYRMWEPSGQKNVRSFAQFEAGFDSTDSVELKAGAAGRVEGAAGSRFVTVPVEIDSRLRNGTRQHFTGTYTLRRVVATGALAAERRWHLYAASIRQVH